MKSFFTGFFDLVVYYTISATYNGFKSWWESSGALNKYQICRGDIIPNK